MDLYQKGIDQNPSTPVYYLKMSEIYIEKKILSQALEMPQTASDLKHQGSNTSPGNEGGLSKDQPKSPGAMVSRKGHEKTIDRFYFIARPRSFLFSVHWFARR
jgi:hypothetical protein